MTALKKKVSLLKCSMFNYKTSGSAPESLANSSLPENDEETVNKILKHCENHRVFQKLNVIKMKL